MIVLVAIAVLVGLEDARNREIPNRLSGALALIGLLIQLFRLLLQANYVSVMRLAASLDEPLVVPFDEPLAVPFVRFVRMLPSPVSCIGSAVFTLCVLTVAELFVRAWRNAPGLGFGDIKYVSAWATILGVWVLFILCVGCLAGMIWALIHRQATFALGPWLSGAAVLLCFIFVVI